MSQAEAEKIFKEKFSKRLEQMVKRMVKEVVQSYLELVEKKSQELISLTLMVKEAMRGELKKEDLKSMLWLLESKKRELEEEADKLTDELRDINFREVGR